MSPYKLPTTTVYLAPDALKSKISTRFEHLAKKSGKEVVNLPINASLNQLKNISLILKLTDTDAALISPKYSSKIYKLCNTLSPLAKKCKAVDFIVIKKNKMQGHFLMGKAFLRMLKKTDSVSIQKTVPWYDSLKRAAKTVKINIKPKSEISITKSGRPSSKRIPLNQLEQESWKIGLKKIAVS